MLNKKQSAAAKIAVGLAVIALILGVFEYKKVEQKKILAQYAFEYANTTDPNQQELLKAKLESALDNISLSRKSSASKPGVLDQLIACSVWANHAEAVNNSMPMGTIPGANGWGYYDFLFYCFYDDPGVAYY